MSEKEYFEKIAQYKLLAKHEIGQNFLIEPRIAEKIVSLLDLQEGESVLEIGSGAGSLTYFLAKHENQITCIDIDESLIAKTQQDFSKNENVIIQMGNAMRWDYSSYDKIIGNLPYYITSGLVERSLLGGKKSKKLVFMVQKEWYQRLFSKPKSKDYGPLSILLEYRATKEESFNVSKSAFSPAPHIDSVVFSLKIRENSTCETADKLYSLACSLFLHRRKTILNNLYFVTKEAKSAEEALKKAKIEASKRPEELSLDDYLRILAVLN